MNRLLCMVLLLLPLFLWACSSPPPPPSPSAALSRPVSPAQTPQSKLPPTDTCREVTLVAVGDLMVHGEQLRDAYNPQTGEYDFSHNFSAVSQYLSAGDLCIGNLETVLGGSEMGYSDYPKFNTPDSFGAALKQAGFGLLTTANNHCMDQKEAGLLRTIQQLDALGIPHTGTFATPLERSHIELQTINGLRIAFVSFTYGTNGIPMATGSEYQVSILDQQTVAATLAAAREQNPHWIVALPHMGNEYETTPLPIFTQWVDLMLYHGADMVLASHPHVLQPMEVKEVTGIDGQSRDAFVIYSLGNFISSQRYLPRETGIILKMRITQGDMFRPQLTEVSFLPTWVQFQDATGASNIRVLPIYDALLSYANGENLYNLRPQDTQRLKEAHSLVTSIYLDAPVPQTQIQREYRFYTGSGPAI